MSKDKYRPRFARMLSAGMFDDKGRPLSVAGCCLFWKVAKDTYYAWINKYPKFAAAAEQAKLIRAIWWENLNSDVASGEKRGNSGLIQFALKNIDGINWADKVDVNNHFDDEVKTIQIEMLPTRIQRVIEHDAERSDSITDEVSD